MSYETTSKIVSIYTVHIQLYLYGSYTAVSVQFIYSCICTVHIQLYLYGSYTAVFVRFIYSCICTVHIQLYLYSSYTAVSVRFIYSCICTVHIQLYLYGSNIAVKSQDMHAELHSEYTSQCFHCKINNLSVNTIQEAVFCQGRNFATYSLKQSNVA